MKMPVYVLIADATALLAPMLTITINSSTIDPAMKEARRIAKALFPIYNRFELFQVDETDKGIWRFCLDRVDPEFTTLHD